MDESDDKQVVDEIAFAIALAANRAVATASHERGRKIGIDVVIAAHLASLQSLIANVCTTDRTRFEAWWYVLREATANARYLGDLVARTGDDPDAMTDAQLTEVSRAIRDKTLDYLAHEVSFETRIAYGIATVPSACALGGIMAAIGELVMAICPTHADVADEWERIGTLAAEQRDLALAAGSTRTH